MSDIEGWIGEMYVRLYGKDSVTDISRDYQAETRLPGYQIIGSNDLGDALCLHAPSGKLHWIPFVPLDAQYAQPAYDSLESLADAAKRMRVNAADSDPQYGLEVHYVMPMFMGGDTRDKENVKFAPRAIHQRLCKYWNGVYYRMADEQRRDA